MNDILKIVLSLSVSGALLILLLSLCKPLMRDKTSKRWQYYVWLLVIARLLLPFTPETSLAGALFQGSGQTSVQMDAVPSPGETSAPAPEPEKGGTGDSIPRRKAPAPQRFFDAALKNLWAVWLVAALVLLIRKITIYQGFARYIRAGREAVADPLLLNRLAQIGEQAGVKRPVELYTNSLISSPLLLGFFRPCIVLPTADLPDPDFQYTILHELIHFRRGDMFYKWLVQLVICLHWFNPLVYWMGREINRACELACDEAVIRDLNPAQKRAYGDTLIHAIGAGGVYKNSLASVTLNESKELLKERLGAIMKSDKRGKAGAAIAAALAVAVFVLGYTLGAYRASSAPLLPAAEPSGSNAEYGMTVYVGGEDISREIVRLWTSANNIYNVDDTEMFRMGDAVFLFDDGPEYIEIFNYDQEVDAVFTVNGKAELEQTLVGGPYTLIQKQGGRTYRMGAWKTGYSYADALEGMRILEFSGDTLVLEMKYKKPVGEGDPPEFGFAKFTAIKSLDQWYVDRYRYPEAS